MFFISKYLLFISLGFIESVYSYINVKIDNDVNPSSNSTICVNSNNVSYGIGECTSGEIFLNARFLKIGLHNCGSFGTNSHLETSFYNGSLGALSDYYKSGWKNVSMPAATNIAGDITVPGVPFEGS
jgi:hypothetical protein